MMNYRNLRELYEQNFMHFIDKVAILNETGAEITYNELHKKVKEVSNSFMKYKEDTVLIKVKELTLNIVFMLAAWYSNKKVILINVSSKINLCDNYPLFNNSLMITDVNKDIFLNNEVNDSKNSINLGVRPEFALLVPTSGTTGISKFVEVQAEQIEYVLRLTEINYKTKRLNKNQATDLVSAPLTSTPMLFCLALFSLSRGWRLILNNDYTNPLKLINIISNNNINFFGTTPTLMQYLLLNNQFVKHIENIEIYILGGEIVSGKLLNRLKCITSNSKFISAYGLSETLHPITGDIDSTDSVNKILKGFECRIEDGLNTKYGEIVIRGKSISKYYYDLNNNRKPILNDGWLYTGDIGYIDNNNIYIMGRRKNIIIVAGKNVQIEEVEQCIGSINGVLYVDVFLKKDKIHGEKVCANIVVNKKMNKREILDYCKLYLEGYKVPTEINFYRNVTVEVKGLGKKSKINNTDQAKEQKLLLFDEKDDLLYD